MTIYYLNIKVFKMLGCDSTIIITLQFCSTHKRMDLQ